MLLNWRTDRGVRPAMCGVVTYRVIRIPVAAGTSRGFNRVRRISVHVAELPFRRRRDDTMAMPLTRHYTAADLATMPDDGQRYEIIQGELVVSPSPGAWHQLLIAQLFGELRDYLKPHGLMKQVLMAPADITFADDTVLEPDLFVADTADAIKSGNLTDITTLFLVVEVISHSTARTDRTRKRPTYQAHGIPQYWIVDGDQRHVEVWTPDAQAPIIERERLVWRHPAVDAECVVDLLKLFDFG